MERPGWPSWPFPRRIAIAGSILFALLIDGPIHAQIIVRGDPPSLAEVHLDKSRLLGERSVDSLDWQMPLDTPADGATWPDTPATEPLPRLLSQPDQAQSLESDLASPQMIAWLKSLIRDNLPESYEDVKKWDQQKEVWDGIDFSHDGLKIKTKRKHKLVNHGTWTRYRLHIVEPEKYLDIQFHRLQMDADGKINFDVSCEMLLDVFGRLSQWVRDVQILSLSANADAVCKLSIQGTVEFQMNPLRFPPDIMIKPHVDQARIELIYFRVRRLSQLRGALALHLGNGLRRVLEGKLEESNDRLTEKINRQLEKHRDRMVFSTQDWLHSKLPLPSSE